MVYLDVCLTQQYKKWQFFQSCIQLFLSMISNVKLAYIINNKNTKVLTIYSVIFSVISVNFVTLTPEYAMDDLDMIIFVISDSKSI